MLRFLYKPTLITYFIVAFMTGFVFLTNPASVGFSSDAVYLPALFSDIFLRGYHFSSWYLTPAPYFFPDMLVFFIIQSLAHNVFYAFLIYAVFQNILLLYLISKIAVLVTQNRASILLTQCVFLLVLIFVYPGHTEVYGIFLKSAHHVGTLINGLILICLLITYKRNTKNSLLLAILAIGVLGAASDIIFVVQFVLPIMASLFLCRLFKIQMTFPIAKIFFILIVSCLIGYFLRNFVGTQSHFSFILVHAFGVSETYHKIYVIFKEAFLTNPFMGFITLIFYFIIALKCLARIFFRKKYLPISSQQELTFFLLFFILMSVAFTCESMSINGILSARYLLNIFWFPIFFFWILCGEKLNVKILLIVFYVVSIGAVSSKLAQNNSYVFDYTPETVQCVDGHVHEYNVTHIDKIKYGISTYWQEKLLTVFSKEGVIMSQYTHKLVPRLWITSAENYRSAYDFAVLSKDDMLDVGLIKQINGSPSFVFKCDDRISLLIYGKNRLRVPDDQVKQ